MEWFPIKLILNMEPLKKAKNFKGPQGPVVLAILDGVGIGTCKEGDVVSRANTPTLDWLAQNALSAKLKAHGTAVGMPSDADMGNSEIGHNAIGCGRVFDQGAKLVKESIENRALFDGDVVERVNRKRGSAIIPGFILSAFFQTATSTVISTIWKRC